MIRIAAAVSSLVGLLLLGAYPATGATVGSVFGGRHTAVLVDMTTQFKAK